MIQLHPDYLLFKTASGEAIPCSAEEVTIELMGESASLVDPEVIRQAAAAVLHYFKIDLGRTSVSVNEFSGALARVLRGLGFDVQTEEADGSMPQPDTADLMDLLPHPGEVIELGFFCQLRDQLREKLRNDPEIVQFNGLRPCVKQLVGVKRWNTRCQELSDQIVEFVRNCLQAEEKTHTCRVVIRAHS